MPNFIVTIDGPAGVGKSCMAQRLACKLDLPYLDTGAMFRSLAWKLGDGAWEWDEAELQSAMESFVYTLSGVGDNSVLSLDDAVIGTEIRTEQVGMWASNLATLSVVRVFLKRAQQSLGERFSLVAEGRDMGTVVFPQAKCKFFLDGSVAVRAQRRFRQLQKIGKNVELSELIDQIAQRDHQDRNRAVAPLKAAEDAIVIDTTEMDREQVFLALVQGVHRECHSLSLS